MRRREFLTAASGAAGAAAATSSAAAQTPSPTPAGNETATDGDGGGQGGGTETVTLVDYAFEPATESPLYVSPGTTVNFVWETNTHNIVVDSQPGDANWEGHENIENAGFEYSHTFEVTGEYAFHCQPHAQQGMEGTIIVNEDGAPPGGDGGGEAAGPVVSESAKALGIATVIAMSSTLGLAFFLMKYGGAAPRDDVEA